MLAILGEITFEALTSPRAMTQDYRWEYAVEPVIEGRAKLQWVADGLGTMNLEMLFHRSFSDPAVQVERLLTAASDHLARPLVFGNGDFRGYFVITKAQVGYEQLSAAGDVVAIAMRVELLQWDFSETAGVASALSAALPLAAVVAPPGTETSKISTTPAAGVASDTLPIQQGYSGLESAAAGVSLLLELSPVENSVSGPLAPGDVPAAQIVRAGV